MYQRHTYYSDYCDKPSCVYRLYDIENTLLYVGMSVSPEQRLIEHRRKPWGAKIARQDVEWFCDRETAKAAEKRVIHDEEPLFNISRPKVSAA